MLQRKHSTFISLALFPENSENSIVFKNINSDFYNFTVFVTTRYLFSKKFSFPFVNL